MKHMTTEWQIDVGDESTRAVFEPASVTARGTFVFAHGAGGNMADRGMQRSAEVLRARGLDVVRFNFMYREKKSSRPDPMPKLTACISAVVDRTRRERDPGVLIIGGRSMGGRAASMMAAEGFACDGLLLLAYPLHPAGRQNQLRDGHLPQIRVPVLCINGTRDPLCTRSLMDAAVARVTAPWTMHWVDTADHSFHVLKSSGKTDDSVQEEIGDVAGRWLDTLRV
jgi:uncharacterized protein